MPNFNWKWEPDTYQLSHNLVNYRVSDQRNDGKQVKWQLTNLNKYKKITDNSISYVMR